MSGFMQALRSADNANAVDLMAEQIGDGIEVDP